MVTVNARIKQKAELGPTSTYLSLIDLREVAKAIGETTDKVTPVLACFSFCFGIWRA